MKNVFSRDLVCLKVYIVNVVYAPNITYNNIRCIYLDLEKNGEN